MDWKLNSSHLHLQRGTPAPFIRSGSKGMGALNQSSKPLLPNPEEKGDPLYCSISQKAKPRKRRRKPVHFGMKMKEIFAMQFKHGPSRPFGVLLCYHYSSNVFKHLFGERKCGM
uniref:Uncharacterized protein n=1 Tax=Salvator merianae TaxID=96440 RepID=A0A8D0BT29_SALMN